MIALGILLRCGLVIADGPAFLGIPDSGSYIFAAHTNLFLDPVHPVGYAVFLRLLHSLVDQVLLVTLVQHALGVATAILLFVVTRPARIVLVRLVPMTVVLFNGLEVWTEHAPLSDPLFSFLTAGVLLLAVRSGDSRRRQLVLLGATLGAAALIRTVGLLLVVAVGVWIACQGSGPLRDRLVRAGIPVSIALALSGAYVIVQHQHSGVLGFTAADGRITYAVAAPFANCARFHPPAGTRALCQSRPPHQRESFNAYLWGFPDGASQVPAGGRASVSPAWRVFGPMPGGSDALSRFGRTAILHQPVAYIRQVLRNFSYYWRDRPSRFLQVATQAEPTTIRADAAYYPDARGVVGGHAGLLSWYSQHVELDGLGILFLLAGSLLPLVRTPLEARNIGLLCAGVGWLLLLGAAMVASDGRYALPALGPLAGATSIGALGVKRRFGRTANRPQPASGGRRSAYDGEAA